MRGINSLGLDRLRTLFDAVSKISFNSFERNLIVKQIVDLSINLVNGRLSSMYLMNKGDGRLFLVSEEFSEQTRNNLGLTDISYIANWVLEKNESLVLSTVSSDSKFFNSEKQLSNPIMKDILAVPLEINENYSGVIVIIDKLDFGKFTQEDKIVIENFAFFVEKKLENIFSFEAMKENFSALSSWGDKNFSDPIVFSSSVMSDLLKTADEISKTNTLVLISGEPGTGKKTLAKRIHFNSLRKEKPFVQLNCKFLSAENLDLKILEADAGTLFLDRIEDLSLELQEKLYSIIQSHKVRKFDSEIEADIRIIVSTRGNLGKLVETGKFRNDLYYRLFVVPVNIPPLRERRKDIETISNFYLEKFSVEMKKTAVSFSEGAMKSLFDYSWPGNTRELKNVVERACMLSSRECIDSKNLSFISGDDFLEAECDVSKNNGDKTLKTAINNFKMSYIRKILEENNWNQTAAGKVLGIQRTYVSRLLKDLDLR